MGKGKEKRNLKGKKEKYDGNNREDKTKALAPQKKPFKTKVIPYTFDHGTPYNNFLDSIRITLTGRVVKNHRVTWQMPLYDSEYCYLDLPMFFSTYGITLRIRCHDVYCVSIERLSKKGDWHCLDKTLVNLLEGGVSLPFSENYNDMQLEEARLGYGPLTAAIKGLDSCENLDKLNEKHHSKELEKVKMFIRNILVNVCEATRFTEIGNTISGYIDNIQERSIPNDWLRVIRSWKTNSKNIAKSWSIKNTNDYLDIQFDDNWYTQVPYPETICPNIKYDKVVALLSSSRVNIGLKSTSASVAKHGSASSSGVDKQV